MEEQSTIFHVQGGSVSYCVSVVTVNPTSDPIIDDTPLFDRPPLTDSERIIWSKSPRTGKPFPLYADGRRRHLGPLLIEESLQASGHACYIPGLHTYCPGEWEGRGYFLYADTGRLYPPTATIRHGEVIYDSEPLVVTSWDDDEHDNDSWGYLSIRTLYRQPANTFLRAALAACGDHRILIVCEYNGNVSGYLGGGPLTGDEKVHPNPEAQRLGPLSLSEFWHLHDSKRIIIPSLICIE
jgi:hypothetical protein